MEGCHQMSKSRANDGSIMNDASRLQQGLFGALQRRFGLLDTPGKTPYFYTDRTFGTSSNRGSMPQNFGAMVYNTKRNTYFSIPKGHKLWLK